MAVKKLILDASVVIKWFIDEEDSDKAALYLNAFQQNQLEITVPSLLFYEVGNFFVSHKVGSDRAGEAMLILRNLSLGSQDVGLQWLRNIYQNSLEYGLTFYDATYITLLQNTNCEFVTADKKLFQKVQKSFSGVKFL